MEATSRKGRRKEMITEKLKKRNSKVKMFYEGVRKKINFFYATA
jgi:hypothetical protein